jgi:hypothetical protein
LREPRTAGTEPVSFARVACTAVIKHDGIGGRGAATAVLPCALLAR